MGDSGHTSILGAAGSELMISAWLHPCGVSTRTGHRLVMSVLFYWQLSPVTTNLPPCKTWASLRAWQKPLLGPSVRKNEAIQYSRRLSGCVDWAVLCHLPTEPSQMDTYQGEKVVLGMPRYGMSALQTALQ